MECPNLTSDFQPKTQGRPDAYCSLYGECVLTYSTQEIYLLPVDPPDRLDICSALDASGLSAGHSLPGQSSLSPGSRHQDFPPRVTTP